jgi:hypothetical protein
MEDIAEHARSPVRTRQCSAGDGGLMVACRVSGGWARGGSFWPALVARYYADAPADVGSLHTWRRLRLPRRGGPLPGSRVKNCGFTTWQPAPFGADLLHLVALFTWPPSSRGRLLHVAAFFTWPPSLPDSLLHLVARTAAPLSAPSRPRRRVRSPPSSALSFRCGCRRRCGRNGGQLL